VGGKAWAAAQGPLAGLARRHTRKPRPREVEAGDQGRPAAARCYALAASSRYRQGSLPLHDPLSKICDKVSRSAPVPGTAPASQMERIVVR